MTIDFVKRENYRLYSSIEKRMNRIKQIENVERNTAQAKRAYTLAVNLHKQTITKYFNHCKKNGIEIRND